MSELYNDILKFTKAMSDTSVENFFCIKLDKDNCIIDVMMESGEWNKVCIDYNKIFRWLMTGKDYGQFIITHNHPYGVLKPSKDDRVVVQHILKLQWMLQQPVMKDSIIFDYENDKYYSFEEDGLYNLIWNDLCEQFKNINTMSCC